MWLDKEPVGWMGIGSSVCTGVLDRRSAVSAVPVLRVPYFILIYSVVHTYFCYGLPRRIHAFPSGWLGSFGSNYRLTAATSAAAAAGALGTTATTSPVRISLSELPLGSAQWLAYDLLFKVYLTPPQQPVIVAQLHGKVAKLNF